ncbi:hypothetical protein, partial [Alistipes finegoldii]|uniref:hypothetical protein n=1 Tax=Alistipes finegoldii TaxID=214856 RepID=UPI001C376C4A
LPVLPFVSGFLRFSVSLRSPLSRLRLVSRFSSVRFPVSVYRGLRSAACARLPVLPFVSGFLRFSVSLRSPLSRLRPVFRFSPVSVFRSSACPFFPLC